VSSSKRYKPFSWYGWEMHSHAEPPRVVFSPDGTAYLVMIAPHGPVAPSGEHHMTVTLVQMEIEDGE